MEALVNAAYDRMSEDVILLYDLADAWREASPRPSLPGMMSAIQQVLKEEDRGFGSLWKSSDPDDSRASMTGGGSSPGKMMSASSVQSLTSDSDNDVAADAESALHEVLRAIFTSVLSDLAVLPFWTVKISAVAHRGRLPELWPFQGYYAGISAIYEEEGFGGLFKGAGPVCTGGLLRFFRRNRRLYSDYYWKTTHRLSTRLLNGDYERHSNDPEVLAQSHEGIFSRMIWATLLHPFDLVATRMMTESSPAYATFRGSVRHVLETRGWAGLFLGVRASVLNSVLPFGNWYLMGVPFLVKTRRCLDGTDAVFRAGMGGSLDLIRAVLRDEGIWGLFAGWRATAWGVLPAFATLCAARLLVYRLLGGSPAHSAQRRRRKALLRKVLSATRDEDELLPLATTEV